MLTGPSASRMKSVQLCDGVWKHYPASRRSVRPGGWRPSWRRSPIQRWPSRRGKGFRPAGRLGRRGKGFPPTGRPGRRGKDFRPAGRPGRRDGQVTVSQAVQMDGSRPLDGLSVTPCCCSVRLFFLGFKVLGMASWCILRTSAHSRLLFLADFASRDLVGVQPLL
jgi:hypothetical protein